MYVFLTGTIDCATGQGEAEVSSLVAVGDGVGWTLVAGQIDLDHFDQ